MSETQLFMVEETKELVYEGDKLDEWNELVESLGLEGQQSLSDGGKSPIPFLYMNAGMVAMFEILCPKKNDVSSYSKAPIPLEVLGLIKLSENEGYFEYIKIWHDNADPDPIAVGVSKKDGETNHYLLARWGDEALSFEHLLKKARQRFIDESTAQIKEKLVKLQGHLDCIGSLADKKLAGEWVYFD